MMPGNHILFTTVHVLITDWLQQSHGTKAAHSSLGQRSVFPGSTHKWWMRGGSMGTRLSSRLFTMAGWEEVNKAQKADVNPI